MRKVTRAIARQRAGQARTFATAAEMQAPHGRPYDTAAPSRPRASPKMSGSNDPRYGCERWRQLSRKVRRERPRCEGECEGYWPSQYADHIVEITDDTSDANFFNEANIAALCARCHGRKTKREAARRAGLPEPKQGAVNCGVDPATGYPRSPQDKAAPLGPNSPICITVRASPQRPMLKRAFNFQKGDVDG